LEGSIYVKGEESRYRGADFDADVDEADDILASI
jgi:hypothetical protein